MLEYYYRLRDCIIFLKHFLEDPITVLKQEYSKECDLKYLPKQVR
jgi:hypothetical protein